MAAPKRGPKPPTVDTPLPFERTGDDVADFERFCSEYIRLDKRVRMQVTSWQREILEMLWCEPRPKAAALAIGRGNAKSTLSSAICLYLLYLNEDYQIDLLAYSEEQAGIIGRACAKMISRHPELEKRAKVYRDHVIVGTSELTWLAAIPAALEGRTPDFTCVDEGGRVEREVFEVASFSVMKKPWAQLFLIGTPGPKPDNVLATFRDHALNHPEDTSQRYMEFSANSWPDHEPDCDDHGGGPGTGCLSAANPSLREGGWTSRESILAVLPPKTSMQHWRRVVLVQFWATGAEDPFIDPSVWSALGRGESIPKGAEVVIGLDGAFGGRNSDACALVVGTVSHKPHFDVLACYENPNPSDSTWRVDLLQVEQDIRDAAKKYRVREVIADPFRLGRTLAILASEGITVAEFPWSSAARVTKATTSLHSAAIAGEFTHSGSETLTRHVGAANVIESNGGLRIGKASTKRSAAKIDGAAALLMAHSRCVWLANTPKKKRGGTSFRY